MMNSIKSFGKILASAIWIISFSSCGSLYKQTKNDIKNSRDINKDYFVEFENGKIEHYNNLTYKISLGKAGHLITDKGEKIETNKIRSYQVKDYYATRITNFNLGDDWYRQDVLYGFAVRALKGKLNLYTTYTYRSKTEVTTNLYFLAKGEDNNLIPYSSKSLGEMIKDNPEVASHAKILGLDYKKIKSTILAYNQ